MAHSPLKMFDQYFNKQVLISGQGPTTEIAHCVDVKLGVLGSAYGPGRLSLRGSLSTHAR